jgi:hypothetical protein
MSEQAAPAPAPAPAEKPGGGIRALAALAAIITLFAVAIFGVAAADIAGTPTLKECNADISVVPSDGKCYDGGKAKRTIQVGLMFIAALIGAVAVILGFIFAIKGTRGPLFLQLLIAAIVIGGISLALDLV